MTDFIHKPMFEGQKMVDDATKSNPYLVTFDQRLQQGQTYANAVRYLFRERNRLASIGRKTYGDDITEALLAANLGLAVKSTVAALQTIEKFYSNHRLARPPLDREEAFSLALARMWQSMQTYDPDMGTSFYDYAVKAIEGEIFRNLTLPNQIKIPQEHRQFIFFNEKPIIKELREQNRMTDHNLEDQLAAKHEQTFVGQQSYPENFRNSYRALCQPWGSLEAIQRRRAVQEFSLSRQGFEDIDATAFLPPSMITTEPEGTGDPQDREKLLFDNFDPGDEEWQSRMWEMLRETGFLAGLTLKQKNVLALGLQLMPDESNEHFGAFLNSVETGVILGVSYQAVSQLWGKIWRHFEKFLAQREIN